MFSKLYLVPSPLGNCLPETVIPVAVFQRISSVRHFAVENERSARRYLSALGFKGMIDSLNFYEISEHTSQEEISEIFEILKGGSDMALISEAGLPAVADPGTYLVELAHNHNIEVIPLSGPSSLMMALMSSGLNGQCFAFTGYLPVKSAERRKRIKELELRSEKYNETEIIIETPYRNDSLFQDILSVCSDFVRVCIAADITLPSQFIKTKRVSEWKKNPYTISKRPCVFLILA